MSKSISIAEKIDERNRKMATASVNYLSKLLKGKDLDLVMMKLLEGYIFSFEDEYIKSYSDDDMFSDSIMYIIKYMKTKMPKINLGDIYSSSTVLELDNETRKIVVKIDLTDEREYLGFKFISI